jgi:hypothetical protein
LLFSVGVHFNSKDAGVGSLKDYIRLPEKNKMYLPP